MGLSTDIDLEIDSDGGARAQFSLEEGQERVFIFKEIEGGKCGLPPSSEEAQDLFEGTVHYWRKWLSACTYRGRWREQVYRSALVLKLLTFEPTGAIVAAPTSSLPEGSVALETGTIAIPGCETRPSRYMRFFGSASPKKPKVF